MTIVLYIYMYKESLFCYIYMYYEHRLVCVWVGYQWKFERKAVVKILWTLASSFCCRTSRYFEICIVSFWLFYHTLLWIL